MAKHHINIVNETIKKHISTSKRILQLGDMGIRSPLANVKVLLSSSTELRFSIQMASTGPSKISHTWSPYQRQLHIISLSETITHVGNTWSANH